MNSPTVSACYVVLLVLACAGFGTRKTRYGSKSTACTRKDGSMLTRARSSGTLLAFTPKVSRSIPLPVSSYSHVFRLESQVRVLHRLFKRWCHRCHSTLCPQPGLWLATHSMSRGVPVMDDVRDPKTATRRHEQARPTKTTRRRRAGRARAASVRYALHYQGHVELDTWFETRSWTLRRTESARPITTTSSLDWHAVRATYTRSKKRRKMKTRRCPYTMI